MRIVNRKTDIELEPDERRHLREACLIAYELVNDSFRNGAVCETVARCTGATKVVDLKGLQSFLMQAVDEL